VKKKSTKDGGTSVRNLDQIEEQEPGARSSRASALIMASFGGACIVFAALAMMRSPMEDAPEPTDPLGDLVAQSKDADKDRDKKKTQLDSADVTFPGSLSDQDNPTTAMEVVRGGQPLAPPADTAELPRYDMPPPAGDQLPVVPLPAQDVLGNTHSALARGDTLRKMAVHVAREPEKGEVAEAGHAGGYQLQVSSFKEKPDAETFAMVLRRRGHKAYVQAAHVKGRGLWHRVRIGPFKYKRSAQIYRQDFEAKERMVTFVVNPPKTRIRIGMAD
jgi:cell division septation protein DedD